MIKETAAKGAVRPNTGGRPGKIVEYNFGRQIGVNMKGQPSSSLRVAVDNAGNVITAFPY